MKRILTFIIIIFSISVSFSQVDNKSDNSQSSQNTTTNFSNFTISVTIGGDFPITGTFPAYINERVDQFVTKMYLSARQNALNNINNSKETSAEINDKLNNFSLRGIILKKIRWRSINSGLKKI